MSKGGGADLVGALGDMAGGVAREGAVDAVRLLPLPQAVQADGVLQPRLAPELRPQWHPLC